MVLIYGKLLEKSKNVLFKVSTRINLLSKTFLLQNTFVTPLNRKIYKDMKKKTRFLKLNKFLVSHQSLKIICINCHQKSINSTKYDMSHKPKNSLTFIICSQMQNKIFQ